MRKLTPRLACLIVMAIVLQLSLAGEQAHAIVPYPTMSVDNEGRFIPTPNAFVPGPVWRGFSDPEDLFVTADDEIYVADTGNNRIVQLNADGRIVRTIPAADGAEAGPDGEPSDPKAQLRGPEGVFVDQDGTIYVADTNSRRVAIFDKEGKYVREIKSPDTNLLPKTYSYVPSKIVIDIRGYIYLVSKGGYQGLLQLTPEGDFVGFFGANKVKMDWLTSLKRKYYTEEQLKKEQAVLPGAIGNVAVDSKGFMYTVNARLASGQLKRLNFAGDDLFNNRNFAWWISPVDIEAFGYADVSIDQNGIMTAIQKQKGQIFQFDTNGRLLFRMGLDGTGSQRLGLFKAPASIATLKDGTILAADSAQNNIQTFQRTRFGDLMHEAITAYNEGQYSESEAAWNEILKIDALFDRAYLGLAKYELQQHDFRKAAEYFEIASDRKGYSDAFWEIRMEWLLQYFSWVMLGVMALLIGGFLLRTWRRMFARKPAKAAAAGSNNPADVPEFGIDPFTGLIRTKVKNRWLISVLRTFSLLRHPVGTMDDIVEKGQVRFWYAVLLVFAGFGVSIAGKSIVSYLFNDVEFVDLNFKTELLYYLLPWITWVVANYLVGSVLKGEGSFVKVFIVNAYALVPAILFTIPIALFSNVLTLDEGILYHFLHTVIQLWVVALMFLATQTVHNYNFKESVKMIGVSLVTFGCLWVFGFVLVGLLYMTTDFFAGLGRELLNRV